MRFLKQDRRWTLGIDSWMTIAAYVLALLMIVFATQLHAQTFSVIHSFTGGSDGSNPWIGLTLDKAGNLYSGTAFGGNKSEYCGPTCGMIFKMTRSGSSWLYYPLYLFTGQDGAASGQLTFAPDGSLYGIGGTYVYHLKPPATSCKSFLCEWTNNVIWTFCCGIYSPGGLTFDKAGNLYGTSEFGSVANHCSGGLGCGYIFQLVPLGGDNWTYNEIYQFHGGDGAHPEGTLIFDQAGNLYGTTGGLYGGDGNGNVFELTPSGAGYWNETILYTFQSGSDGRFPIAGVIFDSAGNLYGASSSEGVNNGGAIFELTASNGWRFNLLYSPSGSGPYADGVYSSLIMDGAGNLYGTNYINGAYNLGSVFKLSPSNGGWTYTTLHDFTGGSDGAYPEGSLAMDNKGNLYGTTFAGGSISANCSPNDSYQCGVVFEITP
jgi:uncharacterized repeat protein (TIGR03803 family)